MRANEDIPAAEKRAVIYSMGRSGRGQTDPVSNSMTTTGFSSGSVPWRSWQAFSATADTSPAE